MSITRILSKMVTNKVEYIFEMDEKGLESVLKEALLAKLSRDGVAIPEEEGVKVDLRINWQGRDEMIWGANVNLSITTVEEERNEKKL